MSLSELQILVLELAAGGELQHILDDDKCLSESEARKAMRQILEGVSYLHDRNIAHLDLKPQNLLLSIEDSCDDIKLCDFGISKILHPGVTVREILGEWGNLRTLGNAASGFSVTNRSGTSATRMLSMHLIKMVLWTSRVF